MRITEMTVYRGMTVNLGGHMFAKTELGLTATDIDPDDFEQDLENLTEFVNIKLAQEVEKVLPKPSQKTTLMEDAAGTETI